MDYTEPLKELKEKHARIGEAIAAFERLAAGSSPRRGRPPNWTKAADRSEAPKPRKASKKRKTGSR